MRDLVSVRSLSAIATIAEESPESDHNVETSFKRELRNT